MKNIFALSFFLLLLTSSCKDPCKEVNCNFGTCLEGTCLCDDGYEGVNCDQLERDKFVGSWTGPLDCGGQLGSNEATIIVTEDPAADNGLLFQLDFDILDLDPLMGTVSGDIFFISPSEQTLDFPGLGEFPVTISGDGTFNEDNTVSAKIIAAIPLLGNSECTGVMIKN